MGFLELSELSRLLLLKVTMSFTFYNDHHKDFALRPVLSMNLDLDASDFIGKAQYEIVYDIINTGNLTLLKTQHKSLTSTYPLQLL